MNKNLIMRINCPHCDQRAVIDSRHQIMGSVADLYCSCENVACGASYVFTLSHKHDLQPPITPNLKKVKQLIMGLSQDDLRLLKNALDCSNEEKALLA